MIHFTQLSMRLGGACNIRIMSVTAPDVQGLV